MTDHRYDAYAEAVRYLASNGTTVPGRKAALAVRDAYEADLRSGALLHPSVVPLSEASIRQTGQMISHVASREADAIAEPIPPTSLGWCKPCLNNDGEHVPAVTEWDDGLRMVALCGACWTAQDNREPRVDADLP